MVSKFAVFMVVALVLALWGVNTGDGTLIVFGVGVAIYAAIFRWRQRDSA